MNTELYLLTREVANGEYTQFDHWSLHNTEKEAQDEALDNITPKELKSEGSINKWEMTYESGVKEFRTGNWGFIVWKVRTLTINLPDVLVPPEAVYPLCAICKQPFCVCSINPQASGEQTQVCSWCYASMRTEDYIYHRAQCYSRPAAIDNPIDWEF